MVEAVRRILERLPETREELAGNDMLQTWVVHQVVVLGEAAARITRRLRDQHPDIEWAEIVAMRNRLVHGYWDIDLKQVWAVITKEIPPLAARLQQLLDELPQA